MAQIRTMQCQFEVKSPSEKFFDAYRYKVHLMPKMASQVIEDVKLVEGEGLNSIGAVRHWTFIAGGKCETAKEIFDVADDKNKTIVFRLVEGEVMNYYKSYRSIFNVTPTGNGSLVKWTLEFEKHNESVPDPDMYSEFLTTWSKLVDAYLLNA